MWTFIPDHGVAKILHVLINVGGIVTLSLGLAAAVRYKSIYHQPALTSLHGWIGAGAVAAYGTTFLWGAFMSTLTQFAPDSSLRAAIAWLPIHRAGGLISLALSVAAVVTGVVNRLPDGTCYYTPDPGVYIPDPNPADLYKYLPNACKVANGLGISVIFAAGMLLAAVNLRRREPPGADDENEVSITNWQAGDNYEMTQQQQQQKQKKQKNWQASENFDA
jgi:hypothetical protein